MTDYTSVRDRTIELCAPLEIEDHVIQPHDFVSPPKWHLGHTTWFFENFSLNGEDPFRPEFAYLFNSYYESQGVHVEQARRGVLSRPTVREVRAYRRYIDQRILEIWSNDPTWLEVVKLGLEHEMQHQELLLMDIKSILFTQTGHPAYRAAYLASESTRPQPSGWIEQSGGVFEIGYDGPEFAYDNERPRHRVYLADFALRRGLSTNAEYSEFIRSGGYDRPEFWLSDGWAWVKRTGARRPLYWLDLEREYDLSGVRELRPDAAVSHINYFEADAFARWSGARLPTEAEWEVVNANAARAEFWQWTSTAYSAYPGYRPFDGAFAEYNSKFMNAQMVMRGGCLATPLSHYRPTYRNFFYPEMRWQFSGLRLAK